ncbi:MAG: histidine kinase [Actinomycetota bacterium]
MVRRSTGSSTPGRAWLAWGLAAFGLGSLLAAESLKIVFGLSVGEDIALFVPVLVGGGAMAFVGALIATRTDDPIGWILLAIPATTGVSLVAQAVYDHGAPDAAGYVPATYWLSQTPFFASLILLVAVFYLFPTGAIASRRWRWPWRVYVASGIVTIVGFAVQPYEVRDAGPVVTNPIGIEALGGMLDLVLAVAGLSLVVSSFLAFVSLGSRYRKGSADERQQLRWLFFVGALGAVLFLILIGSAIVSRDAQTGAAARVADIVMVLLVTDVVVGIPVATGIAIFKYRLYDVDVVISKTIVYGLLAVFIGAVYVAIVVGVSTLISIDVDSLALSIVATGVVALTFQPTRERVQRFANRVVYGRRSTPYEVLARFSDRVGNTYATEDVLPRTARVIAEGVNAERATIWLHLADELRPAAGWPSVDPGATAVRFAGDELPTIPGEHVAAIRYRGDLLGAVAVEKPRGEPVNPEEVKLVDDLAAQAGLVVSNVRLTADLEARLEVIARQAAELRASRQRIVAAQDEERRRLERNIHDGAQQHLVALAVKLRLARGFVHRDPDRARTMLEETAGQIDEALETLHALALGIYPPRLEEEGVAPALAARFASSDLPVRFHADGIGRYPLDAEAAVYFCVLEALQNAAKYAEARAIDVSFAERDGALTFDVVDDGVGFDPSAARNGTGVHGMRDRLAVLGGDVSLTSAPGRGTIVRGHVPLAEEVAV